MYKLKTNEELKNIPMKKDKEQLVEIESIILPDETVVEIGRYYIEEKVFESCYVYQHVQGGTTTYHYNMSIDNLVVFEEEIVGFWYKGYLFTFKSMGQEAYWKEEAPDLPGTECVRSHSLYLRRKE